jgi:hypothetical protein
MSCMLGKADLTACLRALQRKANGARGTVLKVLAPAIFVAPARNVFARVQPHAGSDSTLPPPSPGLAHAARPRLFACFHSASCLRRPPAGTVRRPPPLWA